MATKKTTKKKSTKKATKKKSTTEGAAKKKAPAKKKAAASDELNVYEELVGAIDGHQPQSAKESDQAYLARLAREVTELDDEQWNSLPEEAQVWVDGAASSLEKSEDIAACPGRPAKAKTTKKKSTEKAPAKKKAPGDSATVPKARRSAGEVATSPTGRAQQLLCSNPLSTDDEIKAQLDKEGLEIAPSTFSMNLSQVKRVLRFLAETDHLKPAIAKHYK